jgi:hypothetical protein
LFLLYELKGNLPFFAWTATTVSDMSSNTLSCHESTN